MAEKRNNHINHRSRVKNRFLKEGLDTFEPHQVMELLLFFALPQGDTNETAHELINKYGSVSGVLDADYGDLIRQKGIGAHSALLLKLIPQLSRRYAMEKAGRGDSFADINRAAEFLVGYYTAVTRETVAVIPLNNRMEMICCVKIGEGSVNSSFVSPRAIAELLFSHNASAFILAHNHPDGDAKPSDDDLRVTRYIKSMFDGLDIPLVEHIVVSGSDWHAIFNERLEA